MNTRSPITFDTLSLSFNQDDKAITITSKIPASIKEVNSARVVTLFKSVVLEVSDFRIKLEALPIAQREGLLFDFTRSSSWNAVNLKNRIHILCSAVGSDLTAKLDNSDLQVVASTAYAKLLSERKNYCIRKQVQLLALLEDAGWPYDLRTKTMATFIKHCQPSGADRLVGTSRGLKRILQHNVPDYLQRDAQMLVELAEGKQLAAYCHSAYLRDILIAAVQ